MPNQKRRRYTLKRRAELQQRTRRRITEAAVDLHGSVGPARATISAIAERAGVQRATVYSHFPDEEALFAACSSHYGERNPPPDPEPWRRIADPEQRLRQALEALYAYYRRVAPMLSNVLRDHELVPAMRTASERRLRYLAGLRDLLARGWGARGARRRLLLAGLELGLDFRTWQRLAQGSGLSDRAAAELITRMVAAL